MCFSQIQYENALHVETRENVSSERFPRARKCRRVHILMFLSRSLTFSLLAERRDAWSAMENGYARFAERVKHVRAIASESINMSWPVFSVLD